MSSDSQGFKRAFGGLLLVSIAACLVATGCSDIQPAPDDEGGGLLESQTHEQDTLRESEEHQQQNR